MRPVIMVVADVVGHQPFQMPLVEHDHMIEQVSPAVVYPTFGNAVLQRAAEAGSLGNDAEALDRILDIHIEVGTVVEDQILRCLVVGKCLAQLLCDPSTGWSFVTPQCKMRRRSCEITKKQ
jgi:hypothetical protein